MASPQKENGMTQIANEILEQLALYHLSGNEWKCLLIVIRKSWGWHKKSDAISLSQFEQMSGLPRPAVNEALKKLVGKRVLVVVGKKVLVTEYAFNKNYEEWTSREKGTSRDLLFKPVGKSLPKLVGKKVHTKEIKETKQKKVIETKVSKSKAEFPKSDYTAVLDHIREVQGIDKEWVNYPAQMAAVKRLFKAGYTVDNIKQVVVTMAKDTYWKKTKFSALNIQSNIHKYEVKDFDEAAEAAAIANEEKIDMMLREAEEKEKAKEKLLNMAKGLHNE